MPSLLAFLLLAIYLLKISVAHSSSPSDVSGTPSDATAENPSVSTDNSLSGSGEGKPDILNVTVPRLLREMYFNFSQPNRTQADLLYQKANSIRSFENQARTNDPCQPMRFKLPVHSEGAVYLNSEVHLYHQVPSKQLRKLSRAAKTRQYRVDICIRLGKACLLIPQSVRIAPQYTGWVTFKFPPKFLIVAGQKYVDLKVNVYQDNDTVDCNSWPLKFVLDDSRGSDRISLYNVYMHKPRDSIFQTLAQEAFRINPNGLLKQQNNSDGSGGRERHKRTTTPTPTPTPSRNPCSKHELFIQMGWNLQVKDGKTFGKTFDIGYCSGFCNDLFAVKHTERTSLLSLVKRHNVIHQDAYPEKCVPSSYTDMTVFLVNERGDYDVLLVKDLAVANCMCVV
jgi:hypothetical protein